MTHGESLDAREKRLCDPQPNKTRLQLRSPARVDNEGVETWIAVQHWPPPRSDHAYDFLGPPLLQPVCGITRNGDCYH